MIQIIDKINCCGCEACVQVCPMHCIDFEFDTEGFLYPKIKIEDCINCGLCEKSCPVLNQGDIRKPLQSYAAKNLNTDERLKSSSGGVFILLAKKTINEGGVVFGARFDEHWNVIHSYSETLEGLETFMGSKYVQSRIGKTYTQAKEFLNVGRQVLFSGTPCQIAGLRKFLRKDYANLLTIDVICHGVPSPMVWQDYLREIRENTVSLFTNHSISERDTLSLCDDIEIESISFRDKRLGWKKFCFALTLAEATADGKKNSVSLSHMHDEDPYFLGFNDYNLFLRPSCMNCPTRDLRSGSDITLADFWGIESLLPEFDDDKGISIILANTKKGVSFVHSIKVNKCCVGFEDILCRNKSISINSVPAPVSVKDMFSYKVNLNSKRDYFFYDKTLSVSERVNILGRPSITQQIKNCLRNICKKIIKRLLHKVHIVSFFI